MKVVKNVKNYSKVKTMMNWGIVKIALKEVKKTETVMSADKNFKDPITWKDIKVDKSQSIFFVFVQLPEIIYEAEYFVKMWFQIYLPFLKENVHGIKAEPPLTLTNKPKKRTYDSKKCQICEKILSNSRNLNDHMKAVHSDKSDKPFKCTLCTYSTHVKIYLNR